MSQARIPILMYHGVAWRSVDRLDRRWTVTPELLHEHLRALADDGYTFLTVRDIRTAITRGMTLSPKVAVVTFDDALGDIADHAHDSLTAFGARATIFAPTAHVERGRTWLTAKYGSSARTLSWDELRALAASGHEIGSHGVTHVALDLLDRHTLIDEVYASRRRLEDALNRSVVSFAYPFGLYSPTRASRRSRRWV